MTYTAKLPYQLFNNEAERAAFQQIDWEAAGKAARGRTERFLARIKASRAAANGN